MRSSVPFSFDVRSGRYYRFPVTFFGKGFALKSRGRWGVILQPEVEGCRKRDRFPLVNSYGVPRHNHFSLDSLILHEKDIEYNALYKSLFRPFFVSIDCPTYHSSRRRTLQWTSVSLPDSHSPVSEGFFGYSRLRFRPRRKWSGHWGSFFWVERLGIKGVDM